MNRAAAGDLHPETSIRFAVKTPTTITGRLRAGGFYKLLFLAAFSYMVFLALSYSLCWQDFDIPHKFHPRILSNGPSLRLEDFTRIFDIGPSGYKIGDTRLRYLQDLVSLIDIKFRIWLFNYIPPHPSATLVWIFVFIISPWLMFKLMHQLTGHRAAAWVGTILFTLSQGHLFGVTKMSNPAKPMANFFFLAVFYLAAKTANERTKQGTISRRGRYSFAAMLLLMLLSFFTDETAWMLYFMVPIIFPSLFLPPKKAKFVLGGYLLMSLTAAILITVVFPLMVRTFTPGEVEAGFSHHLPVVTAGPDDPPVVGDFFGPRHVLLTARNLIWSQLVPWGWFWLGIIYLASLTSYLAFQFFSLSPPKKKLVLRLLLALGIFVAIQSFLAAMVYDGEGYLLKDAMYYGAPFSIFLVLPLAILLSAEPLRKSRLLNKGLLLFLAVVMAYNFIRVNEAKRFQNAIYENAGEMDYATAREIWRRRKNPLAILSWRDRYPVYSPWAYIQEIEWVARQYPPLSPREEEHFRNKIGPAAATRPQR